MEIFIIFPTTLYLAGFLDFRKIVFLIFLQKTQNLVHRVKQQTSKNDIFRKYRFYAGFLNRPIFRVKHFFSEGVKHSLIRNLGNKENLVHRVKQQTSEFFRAQNHPKILLIFYSF